MASILNATTTSGLVTSADNSGSLQLQTNNGTTAVTIDTSQNVGVGTTSPSSYNSFASQLVVGGSGDKGLTIASGTSNYGSIHFADGTSGADSYRGQIVYFHTNNYMAFSTDATERMRITSGGDLLVGTTTSYGRTTSASNVSNGYVYASVSVSNQADHMVFKNDATTVGSIARSGGSNVSYNTSSDYRLKENIAPMTGALAKVAQLKPCTYIWKIDGSAGQGFIAHELAEVVPECVNGEKDAINEDGSIKPQGVDTSFLVATLTAAIQEQQAMIEELKAEVQALKGVA